MTTRWTKILLAGGIALFYSLVVFNNVTDFNSNYQFVRHVLSMDTTFIGNQGMWRAMTNPLAHLVFYLSIILWEMVTMAACWVGALRMYQMRRGSAEGFDNSKRMIGAALTLSMMMWLVAFLSVGAEWFLMWQSSAWNGQQAAFRMFVVVGISWLIIMPPEPRY